MVRLLNRLTQPARLTSFFIVVVLAAMVVAVRAQNPAQPLTDTPPPREALTPAPTAPPATAPGRSRRW